MFRAAIGRLTGSNYPENSYFTILLAKALRSKGAMAGVIGRLIN